MALDAYLVAAPHPGVECSPQRVFAEQSAFRNRSEKVAQPAAHAEPEDAEPPAAWWPALLAVLLAGAAGLALFGVL